MCNEFQSLNTFALVLIIALQTAYFYQGAVPPTAYLATLCGVGLLFVYNYGWFEEYHPLIVLSAIALMSVNFFHQGPVSQTATVVLLVVIGVSIASLSGWFAPSTASPSCGGTFGAVSPGELTAFKQHYNATRFIPQ